MSGPTATYLLLQLGVFLLGMDEVENNIKCTGENKREEETEAGEVGIALCARFVRTSGQWRLPLQRY